MTYSTTNCRLTDVYVVKINEKGRHVWQRAYHLAARSFGYSIRELSNGDFIVAGRVEDTVGCTVKGDAFLMRITSVGNVVWVKAYGTSNLEEIGRKVTVAKHAAGNGTAVGDLIVCGLQQDPQVQNSTDAFLFRTDANGNLRWIKTYGGSGLDGFADVIESDLGNNAGDVVACGGTTSYHPGGISQGLICRVNGGTGAIGASPQGAAVYGTQPTWLWGLTEMTVGTNSGNIAYTGGTIPSGSTTPDIYALKTQPDPCTGLADIAWATAAGRGEEGFSIKEVVSGAGGGLTNGNLIITGATNVRLTTMSYDVLLLELDATLNLTTTTLGMKLYGSASYDVGLEVLPVLTVAGQRTAGFFIVGTSTKLPNQGFLKAGDTGQIYVIKTDANGSTNNCWDSVYSPSGSIPDFKADCWDIPIDTGGRRCNVDTFNQSVVWIDTLCNDSLHRRNLGTSPSAPDIAAGAAAVFESALSAWPNPVDGDESVIITGTIARAGRVELTVTDMRGREIQRRSGEYYAGKFEMPVSTAGWASGTYVVTAGSGQRRVTTRIVVRR